MSPAVHRRIQSYNAIVVDIYGHYIENVLKHMRSLNPDGEQILPLTRTSFIQSPEYEDGSFEYGLHHHHSAQSKNPSISPFAAPSGLTHQQFMGNFNPAMHSWDLAYNLDLSSRTVPFIDIDAHDHTKSAYYLNSYALDFFRHGSEALIMSENELDRSETYQLLLDFLFTLNSVKTSLQSIIVNEMKRTTGNDASFFRPLEKKFVEFDHDFAEKFYKHFK